MNITNQYLKTMIIDLNFENNVKDNILIWHMYFLSNLLNKKNPR